MHNLFQSMNVIIVLSILLISCTFGKENDMRGFEVIENTFKLIDEAIGEKDKGKIKILEQQLIDAQDESIDTISYYKTLGKAQKFVDYETKVSMINRFNIRSFAFCTMTVDKNTQKPVNAFCMEGDQNSAMLIHQYIDIGKKRYLCLQWMDSSYNPARHYMGIPRLVFIIYHENNILGEVLFQNQDGKTYQLPCGVAKCIVRKKQNIVITEFADQNGNLIDLNYQGCCISKIERDFEDSGVPVFYCGGQQLNFPYHLLTCVSEGIIYRFWLFINMITYEKMQKPEPFDVSE